MKKIGVIVFVLTLATWFIPLSYGGEHGGTAMPVTHEHGGTTTAPQEQMTQPAAAAAPSASDIRTTIADYIKKQTDQGGDFDVYDPQTKETRELTFVRVHDRVGKTGNYYYSCSDFTDKKGNKVDLDFDVEDMSGKLKVVDVKIHKVNDVARYTYDDKDNRIPVTAAPTVTAPAAETKSAP